MWLMPVAVYRIDTWIGHDKKDSTTQQKLLWVINAAMVFMHFQDLMQRTANTSELGQCRKPD